jgi:hypothetical protein
MIDWAKQQSHATAQQKKILLSHLILSLFVRRKAKKYPSFPLDFTSICERKNKEMFFFPI